MLLLLLMTTSLVHINEEPIITTTKSKNPRKISKKISTKISQKSHENLSKNHYTNLRTKFKKDLHFQAE